MTSTLSWHHIKAISVENQPPDAADKRLLLHRAAGDHTKAHPVVHHVMLHLPEPPPVRSSGFQLLIGERHILVYHAVPGGISFKLHAPQELADLYNGRVRFVSDHGDELASGVSFPDLSRHLTKVAGHRWHKVYRK